VQAIQDIVGEAPSSGVEPRALEQHLSRLLLGEDEAKPLRLYRRMFLIRRFEETLLELFSEGALNGTTHCCIGQEANAVGILEHVTPGDHVFSNHRCHGHYLAHTGDVFGLLAEIMGKAAGVCGGIGGSQHIGAPGFKSNGIQGGIVPAAAGIALAQKLRGGDRFSLVFIGDGTLGEGVVYETLNLAALWQLPLWIVLEDNGWAQSTPLQHNLAGNMATRFAAFGIPVEELDSTDVSEIDRLAEKTAVELRRTRGPRASILHTYRLCHHSKSDDNRPPAEVAARWEREPLGIHAARVADADTARIRGEVELGLSELVQKVRALP
jgi:acetoin:2,6-dichlorophenolindophenol oxidoreductase subunit alpha